MSYPDYLEMQPVETLRRWGAENRALAEVKEARGGV